MKLIKCSVPGWTLEFNNEQELKEELYNNICNICRVGTIEYYQNDVIYEQPPITLDNTIDEMLSSPCGCEFIIELE